MTTQPASASFGPENHGAQVGLNYGTVSTEIHLLPRKARTPHAGPGPQLTSDSVERTETPPQLFATTIPFSRGGDFVDRGDIVHQLIQRCFEPAARWPQPLESVRRWMTGSSKSRLAIEFAYRALEVAETWAFVAPSRTQPWRMS